MRINFYSSIKYHFFFGKFLEQYRFSVWFRVVVCINKTKKYSKHKFIYFFGVRNSEIFSTKPIWYREQIQERQRDQTIEFTELNRKRRQIFLFFFFFFVCRSIYLYELECSIVAFIVNIPIIDIHTRVRWHEIRKIQLHLSGWNQA